jgi:hypothetical protein
MDTGAEATDWETLPTSTRPSPDKHYPNPHWTRGKGCLRALEPGGDQISICRQTVPRHWYTAHPVGEAAAITVETVRGGHLDYKVFYSGSHASNGIGDQLRMRVAPVAGGPAGETCVTAYTASEIGASGVPSWTELSEQCFDRPLPLQGLAALYGDVVFVGTRTTAAPGYLGVGKLTLPDVQSGYLLQDFSYSAPQSHFSLSSLARLFRF